MKKKLIGLLIVSVSLFALDIKVDTHEIKLEKNDIYLKISKEELDSILKEKTKNNKIGIVNSKQIKDSRFYIVEYFDSNNNVLVKTIEVDNFVGVDMKNMYEKLKIRNTIKEKHE